MLCVVVFVLLFVLNVFLKILFLQRKLFDTLSFYKKENCVSLLWPLFLNLHKIKLDFHINIDLKWVAMAPFGLKLWENGAGGPIAFL